MTTQSRTAWVAVLILLAGSMLTSIWYISTRQLPLRDTLFFGGAPYFWLIVLGTPSFFGCLRFKRWPLFVLGIGCLIVLAISGSIFLLLSLAGGLYFPVIVPALVLIACFFLYRFVLLSSVQVSKETSSNPAGSQRINN